MAKLSLMFCRRGASLFELTIWLGLASLLLTLLATLASYSWRIGARLFTRLELGSQARLVGRALRWDLARTSAAGVTLVTPELAAIQPQAALSAERVVQWQGQLVVYWRSERNLFRAERPLAGVSLAAPAPLPPLASLTASTGNVRRLSHQVAAWSLAAEGGLYRWRCLLEQEVPGHPRPERWEARGEWQETSP